ncbi:MAG: CotH kinase family protein [Bacteroidota bacterium]|nr:CotH kinase family protein [Bacteroidota bacterium]
MRYKFLIFYIFLTSLSCKLDKEPNPLPGNQPVVPEVPETPEEPEDPENEVEGAEISTFSINNIDFDIQEGQITAFNKQNILKKELVAVFSANGVVKINGIEQESGMTVNNFSGPVVYTVTNDAGNIKEYIVRYITFTGIAKLYITTENKARITKEEYVPASFDFDPNFEYDAEPIGLEGRIRGRGNTSWNMLKKPYKIKFESKTSFFNMPAHKTWVLIANYADKTLIRNYLAYTLAEKTEMPFPVSRHFVEVFLNDVHIGNYMLTDQIEVDSDRVDIMELGPTDNDPNQITGGYLLEIDHRVLQAQDEPYFETSHFPIVVKSPEEPSIQQMDYISNYLKEAEEALFGEDFSDVNFGFRKYFDEESMIRWFIVSELFKNVDSRHFSSIYIHKNRGGKLDMGPLWDFDLSTGNASHCRDCMRPTGWHVMNNAWFKRMYEDEAFKANVKKLWKQYKPEIDNILPQIFKLSEYLDLSQQANFVLWPKLNEPGATVQNLPDYQSHVEYLHDFLEERINWMDNEFTF